LNKVAGHLEVDETFISSKVRNMHTAEKARKIQGRRGPMGKAIVAAVLERGGKVDRNAANFELFAMTPNTILVDTCAHRCVGSRGCSESWLLCYSHAGCGHD
jgi:hypothetical protein